MSLDVRLVDFNYLFDSITKLNPSSEDVNFPASNLKSFRRANAWRSTSDTATLTIDLKTAEPIDSFAIVFDPVIGSKLTPGATIKLQANATDEWSSPAVDETLSFDETFSAFTKFFSSDQEYRYWRVDINDSGNFLGYIEIHSMFLGRSIQLTRDPSIGFGYSISNQTDINRTDFGHFYADKFPDLLGFTFNLSIMPKADFDLLVESYKRFGNSAPVLFAMDTQAQLFDVESMLVYGVMQGDLGMGHVITDQFSASLDIEEVL